MNLRNSWPISSESQKQSNEISIYKGELTAQCLVKSVATIKKSFPSLPIGFYDVFTDRLRENGFNDDRLRDAIAFVIDNCHYPQPSIAEFISYDRKYKVYTYAQMLKMSDEMGPSIWNIYKPVKMAERSKIVWVDVDDIKRYKLEVYQHSANETQKPNL